MITPLKQEKAKKFGELDKIKIIEIMTCFSVNLQLIKIHKIRVKIIRKSWKYSYLSAIKLPC